MRLRASIAMIVALFPLNVDAISRYTVTAMTCESIKAAIRSEGAVIVRWISPRTGNLLYGRAVANRRYCLANQVTRVTSVPASDAKHCRVNYCVERRVFQDVDND